MRKPHHERASSTHSGTAQPTTKTQAGVAGGETHHTGKRESEDAIRLYAYRKWESAGKPTVDGIQFWLEAEQELMRAQ